MKVKDNDSQHHSYHDYLDDTTALAFSVLTTRINSLSTEDKADVLQLIPELLRTDSSEDKDSALVAIAEILNPEPLSVEQIKFPNGLSKKLAKWTQGVGQEIKNVRNEADMTQKELAKASGIPQSHISRLEKGTHSPTAKTLKKIAKALNVNMTRFDPNAP